MALTKVRTAGFADNAITNAILPTGAVLQVVTATNSSHVQNTTQTYADTGLSCSITPRASTSDVLIMVSHAGLATSNSGVDINLRLLRGSTEIVEFTNLMMEGMSVGNLTAGTNFIDTTPGGDGSTAITYKTQFRIGDDSGTIHVDNGNYGTSTMVLMEIQRSS